MTGHAERRADSGNGRTPRKGAESIATDAVSQPAPRELLGDQPAERVPHDGRLLIELRDGLGHMVGDLAHRLAGEDLGVRPALLDRLGVVGPVRRRRRVAMRFKQLTPRLPA